MQMYDYCLRSESPTIPDALGKDDLGMFEGTHAINNAREFIRFHRGHADGSNDKLFYADPFVQLAQVGLADLFLLFFETEKNWFTSMKCQAHTRLDQNELQVEQCCWLTS